MEYRLYLKDNNEKAYKLFYWFLFSLHWILTTLASLQRYSAFTTIAIYVQILCYAALLLCFTAWRKKFVFERFHFIGYIIHGVVWFLIGLYFVIPILAAVIALSYYVKKQPTYFLFNADGVHLNKIIGKKRYSWNAYENIILKDGLLTLDWKDNHLLQVELKENPAFSSSDFNKFCNHQMIAAH
jgi:hypothetical protein